MFSHDFLGGSVPLLSLVYNLNVCTESLYSTGRQRKPPPCRQNDRKPFDDSPRHLIVSELRTEKMHSTNTLLPLIWKTSFFHFSTSRLLSESEPPPAAAAWSVSSSFKFFALTTLLADFSSPFFLFCELDYKENTQNK